MTNISAVMSISILRCNQILYLSKNSLKTKYILKMYLNTKFQMLGKQLKYISDNFEYILIYIISPYIKVYYFMM